jgi:hypothetical protein
MPVEKLSIPVYVFVPDRDLDFLTNSHVKLDTLVDTQESFSTRHHRIALEYDNDTVNLVVDPTLSTLDTSISKNSNSSGTHQPLNMSALRSRMTHLDSTTMALRSRSLNRNHP